MRVCVIGNSHVAMLASPEAARELGLDLTFFAKPKLARRDVGLEEGALVARTDDMRGWLDRMKTAARLDLSSCDAILIVAMGTSMFSIARITQTHLVSGWPSAAKALKALSSADAPRPARLPLTRGAVFETLTALAEESTGLTLAREIRLVCDTPIIFAPQPYPAETVLADPETYPVFKRLVDRGDGPHAARDLHAAQLASYATIEKSASLTLPEEAVAHGCLTKTDFSRGATRLGSQDNQPVADVMHANAAYGRLLLGQITSAAAAAMGHAP